MSSAERLILVAARSEGLLADFVLLFLIRWGLKYLGLEYVHFQPVLSDVSPPFSFSDLKYPGSVILYGSMYFASGLPELVMAGMWCFYAVIALSIFGRTLGMHQAGLIIVDVNGRKPGFLRILIRQIVAPISSICLIGYWPLGFTCDASALHDLISGTRLVCSKKQPNEFQSASYETSGSINL